MCVWIHISKMKRAMEVGHNYVTRSGKRLYKSRYVLTYNRPFHVQKVKFLIVFLFSVSCTASYLYIVSYLITRNFDFDE